jgi:Zn-dependent M28 family amino/carboxypeptidase
VLTEPNRRGTGGSTYYGITRSTGVNNDPLRQPDEKLRALNSGPVLPDPIPQVFCTKWGTTRRGEMYILGGHMDGIGWGEAANDDASGTAIVMELARVFSMPDVTTDVTIRFALWNGEEGGLRGANAYVNQRKDLQGQPNEPKWLGMIQHDMMMWDHGMPRADGTLSPEQRPEADFNIEFQTNSDMADTCTAKAAVPTCSKDLAFAVKAAADKYSKNYPGTVGPHMTNTDSGPFMNLVPAISMRENERGMHTGAGWNPHWHQPTDLFSTFSDKDFTLGLNSAQATLAAIATLTKAKGK